MIKNFDHVIDNQTVTLCATLADGPNGTRVVISRLDNAQTILLMDVSGPLGMLKVAMESPEALLNRAIQEAIEGQHLENAWHAQEPLTMAL